MSQPDTARRAVVAAVTGMLLAVGGTLLTPEIVAYRWMAIAAVAGIVVGIPLARVPLTAVPERTGAVAGVRRPGRGARRHGEVLPVAVAGRSSRTSAWPSWRAKSSSAA